MAFVACALVGCGGAGSSGGGALPPPAPAPAQGWNFISLGPTNAMYAKIPESGKINAFAIDPTNANVMYIGGGAGTGLEVFSNAGIYRTTNGGASWQSIQPGAVNALWLDPAQPTHILAADEDNGILTTSDSGATWRTVYSTTSATQFAFFGGSLYATTAAGIIASTDRGNTWQISSSIDAPATAFGSAQGVLIAGMANGSVYSYANGAWQKMGTIPFNPNTGTGLSAPTVHQIAVDPLTPTHVYATTNDGPWDQTLFVSTDSGATWKPVNYNGWPQAIAFSEIAPHMLYVGDEGSFNALNADGTQSPTVNFQSYLQVIDLRNIWVTSLAGAEVCWIGSDQGLDRVPDCVNLGKAGTDSVVSGPAGMTLARRLAVSTTGTVMASFQDLQSFSSANGGGSWTSHPGLYEDGFVDFRPGSANVCYAYDENNGVSISLDGCATFAIPTAAQAAILPSRLMTNAMAFDPSNPLHMYFLSGPRSVFGKSAPNGVFESFDGGATFVQDAWPFGAPGAIAIDPHNPKHIVACDLPLYTTSVLWTTFDAGKTWTNAKSLPQTPYWYAIAISPVDGKDVVIANADASGNAFSLHSSDGGLTFGAATTAAARATAVRGSARVSQARRGVYVYSPMRQIRFDQDVTSGVPCAILTTSKGAYESCDFGATWARIDQTLAVHSFWDVRWVGGSVYLASNGFGVLRSAAPGH